MDRSWMYASRLSSEYKDGVFKFLEFAEQNTPDNRGNFRCPCSKCACVRTLDVETIKDHLFVVGFDKGYTKWIWHGEGATRIPFSRTNWEHENEVVEETIGDKLDELINDVEQEVSKEPAIIEQLIKLSEKSLYPGCSEGLTVLSAVLKLFNLKASYGWCDKSFTDLLQALKGMFPVGNEMPCKIYDAKKILCPLGMGYKKIHACPNDCILYRNEYENLNACMKCGVSRYKRKEHENEDAEFSSKNGPPAKVIWYLPIISRLRRLYTKSADAKSLTWHAYRKADDKLRHPTDSPQWKMIDKKYSDFGNDARNIRFGLCTDGINPHGNLSSKHSSWPVLLVVYNLPPWLIMKRKYIMLSLMISGPRQPGNDIDVFLRPLIDDLKILWSEGVSIFDGYRKENFTLRAMLFCTINDFPAYGNLSGYSVKGHKACPICEEDTSSQQLSYGRKTIFLGHRKYLPRYHPYRRKKKAFNGKIELGEASLDPLSGIEVYDKVRSIDQKFGKIVNKPLPRIGSEKSPWKKCSIFFELPYWKELYVRHSLDVMHIEKNICDSLIGTLLNIPGKTKDTLNSRLDMIEMGIRPELAPVEKGKRTYLPPSMCNLGKKEKEKFCMCLYDTKVPQGFSSNIKSLVSLKELKLVGLKSHDCHVLMQHMIPIAIRSVLPNNVKVAITNLCLFFKKICSHAHNVAELDKLQSKVIETLCQLEMYFPPSFFDVMVHLTVHIVREVKLCGPVCFRWMYPFERYMKVLKGYVRNRYRPEACIVESYVAEEVLDFVTDYLAEVTPIGIPRHRHELSFENGRGTRGKKVVQVSLEEVLMAHLYILNNDEEVHPYIETHKQLIDETYPKKNPKWRVIEHNRSFMDWFEKQVEVESDVSSTYLKWLSRRPSNMVITYSAYDISGYSFYTENQDCRSTIQNSGVCVVAKAMHFASSKDSNPVHVELSYYGVIQEIWEVDYGQFRKPVFKCRWFDDSKRGKYVDEFGFTFVNFNRQGHQNEPFVLASQVKQVFYKKDPKITSATEDWHVVLDGRRSIFPEEDQSDDDIPSSVFLNAPSSIIDDGTEDDYICARSDGVEGYWIDTPTQNKTS